MAHEVSLLMNDVCKLSFSSEEVRSPVHELVKWVLNHDNILKIFRLKVIDMFDQLLDSTPAVQAALRAKYHRQRCSSLYQPGDTRMLSVFRMVYRVILLKTALVSTFNDVRYAGYAQRALKAKNTAAKSAGEKMAKNPETGAFVDHVFDVFGSSDKPIWETLQFWCRSTVPIVYLHRMVDTHAPAMHLVYYGSCLVDKQFRSLTAMKPDNEFLAQCARVFNRRWYRWHNPIHTLCYHVSPAFHSHSISSEEGQDIRDSCERLFPDDAEDIRHQLSQWKGAHGLAREQVWKKADVLSASDWWTAYGSDFDMPLLHVTAMKLTSLAASASVCEQGVVGWSKVGCIETQRRSRLLTGKTNKLVNVNGALWSQQHAHTESSNKAGAILDLLDALVQDTLAEGKGPTFADDITAGELTDVANCRPADAKSGADMDSSDDSEDSEEEMLPVNSRRRTLRCNDNLESTLKSVLYAPRFHAVDPTATESME
jgi:hypothetical protein